MIIIKHRVNNLSELILTPHYLGVEIDLRTRDSELIIDHDPFSAGVSFSKWLEHYNHKFLIINVKEEGLESFAMNLMEKFNIKDFFFLDQSFPALYKTSKVFPEFICARVSDVESVETALNLNVSWIWFDSHTGDWSYLPEVFKKLSTINVRKCLVSPELQRTNSESETMILKKIIQDSIINFDAVCTKLPEEWIS